jgi:hypothetical protein
MLSTAAVDELTLHDTYLCSLDAQEVHSIDPKSKYMQAHSIEENRSGDSLD